eukprot:scaffold8732_cov133-Isochrysis_galbana.AAC.1
MRRHPRWKRRERGRRNAGFAVPRAGQPGRVSWILAKLARACAWGVWGKEWELGAWSSVLQHLKGQGHDCPFQPPLTHADSAYDHGAHAPAAGRLPWPSHCWPAGNHRAACMSTRRSHNSTSMPDHSPGWYARSTRTLADSAPVVVRGQPPQAAACIAAASDAAARLRMTLVRAAAVRLPGRSVRRVAAAAEIARC